LRGGQINHREGGKCRTSIAVGGDEIEGRKRQTKVGKNAEKPYAWSFESSLSENEKRPMRVSHSGPNKGFLKRKPPNMIKSPELRILRI